MTVNKCCFLKIYTKFEVMKNSKELWFRQNLLMVCKVIICKRRPVTLESIKYFCVLWKWGGNKCVRLRVCTRFTKAIFIMGTCSPRTIFCRKCSKLTIYYVLQLYYLKLSTKRQLEWDIRDRKLSRYCYSSWNGFLTKMTKY